MHQGRELPELHGAARRLVTGAAARALPAAGRRRLHAAGGTRVEQAARLQDGGLVKRPGHVGRLHRCCRAGGAGRWEAAPCAGAAAWRHGPRPARAGRHLWPLGLGHVGLSTAVVCGLRLQLVLLLRHGRPCGGSSGGVCLLHRRPCWLRCGQGLALERPAAWPLLWLLLLQR